MTSLPLISVIVPVYNGGAQLRKCLDALRASDLSAHEIIVVDDCSSDDAVAKAEAFASENTLSNTTELRFFRLDSRSGPAAARNAGATHASGDVLLFVDADVVVQRDTLERIAELFATQPNISAVFGSYDDSPAETNFVSQYKNLVHHFVHQQSSPEASTFWAGCGAIRREIFNAIGGFDSAKYERPSIEDIELGYRLRRRGFRIVLDKRLQVKHLKRWTLRSLLHADILNRAIPWSRLILEQREIINDLNLRFRDRACAALVIAAIGLTPMSYFSPFFLLGTLTALSAVLLINFSLFRFLWAHGGPAFAAKSFALHTLYYFYSTAAFSFCYARHVVSKAIAFIKPRRTTAGRGLVKDA